MPPPHQLEGSLAPVLVLIRMQIAKARQHDQPLVDPRVVLHRAGAQRIKARVDAEVARRELREVPEDLRLGELREARRTRAPQLGRNLGLREVRPRQLASPPARLRFFEDELHAAAKASARRSMSPGVRPPGTPTSRASSRPS